MPAHPAAPDAVPLGRAQTVPRLVTQPGPSQTVPRQSDSFADYNAPGEREDFAQLMAQLEQGGKEHVPYR